MINKKLLFSVKESIPYIKKNVLYQWIGLICNVCSTACLCWIITKNRSLSFIGIILVCLIVRYIVNQKAIEMSYQSSHIVKETLRSRLYKKLAKIGNSYTNEWSTAEIVQLSSEGVEQLETYFASYIPQFFYSLIAPMTLFIVISFMDMKAALVLLVCVPLIPMSIVFVQKFAKRLLNRYWGQYTKLGDSFLENLQGLTTLKIYEADGHYQEKMNVESENFRKITMRVLTMQLNSTSVMDIIAYGGAAVGMITAIHQYIAGNITIGGALIILLLASEFFIPLRLLGSFFHIAMNGMAASDKIFGLLDLEEGESGESKFPQGELEISLDDVHFAYEKDREILKGITMNFPANSFISFVGESGCGKSTLAGILTARNRGYTGSIKIGGVDISDIMENELMSHMTKITHNSYLFAGTVEENLRMAKPDASKEEMEEVLEKVNLLAFLKEQDGLQTVLSERGENFSGGQRQRLALARALLFDTPIYIFDEATSNIDMESEEMIMNVIRELSKTKMILFISHRLSNVVDSDCIYMMKDGIVAEEGTHEQLIRKKGAYQHLFDKQKELESYAANMSWNDSLKKKVV